MVLYICILKGCKDLVKKLVGVYAMHAMLIYQLISETVPLSPFQSLTKILYTSSEYYRPIALAPILSKILEWCILLEFSDSFATSSLQFGFKSSMSTTLCTGLVKNVVAHYMSRGSPVLACLLDASKAFDLVEHSLLFQQFLDRKVPNFLVRFLLS